MIPMLEYKCYKCGCSLSGPKHLLHSEAYEAGVCRTCWNRDRLEAVLDHKPYPGAAGTVTYKRGQIEDMVHGNFDLVCSVVNDIEQKRALRKEVTPSKWLCNGSGVVAENVWYEPETAVVVGLCKWCGQPVITYKDRGIDLCVEHLVKPKHNYCSNTVGDEICNGPIYGDDYLCWKCRGDGFDNV